jgi:uncharacterized membrane protein
MGVPDSVLYNIVLVLHIAAAIIGFGGTFVSSFYALEARNRPGREGSVIAATAVSVTDKVPTMAVYSVPVLGILLVLLSDDAWKFSQVWISLSFLLYIAIVVVTLVVYRPTQRHLVAARNRIDEGGPNSGLAADERKAASVAGVLNVLWVVVLFLMVFKPGR